MLRGNLRRGLALVRLRTHRAPPLGVTLYERAGCHLCEETHRALRRIGLDRPLAIARVNIATDPALELRYLVRIPVLAVGEHELDAAGLADREIATWLGEVAFVAKRGPRAIAEAPLTRVPERCWLDPRVVARVSSIDGMGLFATAPITTGEVVGILGGRVIDDADLRQIARTRSKYSSAAVGEGVNLLLEDDEVIGRGNHSCDSNVWMRDALTLEARRDIATGDELTVDYALQTSIADWEMACNCGSPLCRRLIRGSDWMRPELQERYRDHFSPFLNERINGPNEQSRATRR